MNTSINLYENKIYVTVKISAICCHANVNNYHQTIKIYQFVFA